MSTNEARTEAGNAGAKVGSTIGGIVKGIHGVGETLRGTINDGLDKAGDAALDRPQGSVASRTESTSNESIVQKGKAEIGQALNALDK